MTRYVPTKYEYAVIVFLLFIVLIVLSLFVIETGKGPDDWLIQWTNWAKTYVALAVAAYAIVKLANGTEAFLTNYQNQKAAGRQMVVGHSIDISCDGPTPDNTYVENGDKVTFHNSTDASVTISFSAPGVFNPSPGSTITIEKGGRMRLTIGTIGSGTDFEYPDCGEALGTRSGRIDPA